MPLNAGDFGFSTAGQLPGRARVQVYSAFVTLSDGHVIRVDGIAEKSDAAAILRAREIAVQSVRLEPQGVSYEEDEDGYPPRCSVPGGRSWVVSDDERRCYCEFCGADGDA